MYLFNTNISTFFTLLSMTLSMTFSKKGKGKGKGILFAGQGGRRHATSKANQRAATHFLTSREVGRINKK